MYCTESAVGENEENSKGWATGRDMYLFEFTSFLCHLPDTSLPEG